MTTPDFRLRLGGPPIDFSELGFTGTAIDSWPLPGSQARYDEIRSLLLALMSSQASFQEPINYSIGSLYFNLNATNAGSFYFRHDAGPVIDPNGEDWVTLAHGIELEPGLSLHQWFEELRDTLVEPTTALTAIFHRFTTAIASEPISAGSLVYPNLDSHVRLADNTDPSKTSVLGATTITTDINGTTVIQHVGLVNLRMVQGLTLTAGDKIYLNTSGRGTNMPPVTGDVILVGVVFDASNYNPIDPDPIAATVIGGSTLSTSSTVSGHPFEAGAALTQNFVVYKTATENAVEHADAASISTSNTVIGAASADALVTETSIVNDFGLVTLRAEVGISIASGDVVYLSTLPGRVTNVAPSVSGEVVLVLGYAKSSTAVAGGTFTAFWATRTPVVNP